jgi:hypothetical protein
MVDVSLVLGELGRLKDRGDEVVCIIWDVDIGAKMNDTVLMSVLLLCVLAIVDVADWIGAGECWVVCDGSDEGMVQFTSGDVNVNFGVEMGERFAMVFVGHGRPTANVVL